MNPVAAIEAAFSAALAAHLPNDPTLAGLPAFAAMADSGDDLPCLIHATVARAVIPTNYTYEAAVAFGVLTSTEPEETSSEHARAIAAAYARLVLSEGFRASLMAAAASSPQPFVITSPLLPGDFAEVEPRDTAVWHQGGQVLFGVQF